MAFLAFAGSSGHGATTDGSSAKGARTLPAVLDVDSLDAHDHCTGCHREMLDPAHKLSPQPHAAHPGRFLDEHPPRRFGCTICHGGNGKATTASEAHASAAGGRPFHSGEATEIACGACHVNELTLAGAPHLSRGRQLMQRAQCDGCHQIGETARTDRPAPNLAGIANRTSPAWLFRWIEDPRAYASNARMPRFVLEDRYVDALVGYLMTFRGGAPFDTTGFPPGDATRGGTLVRMSFCISCHSINDRGGSGAIDLGRVGSKLTRARLLQVVGATHEADPSTAMPQYHFSRGEVADIAAYLQSEMSDPSFLSADADSGLAKLGAYWPSDSVRVDTGRRLFKELRCGNCHAFPGGKDWIRVAPNLSMIGEKPFDEFVWGHTSFPRTLPDYIWHKVETPHVYETTPHQFKMPSYGFTPEEALDVTIALLSRVSPPVLPDAFMVRSNAGDSLAVSGEFGELISRYRCLSCHSVNGVGHNVTYDLGKEGSRVQKAWIESYLKLPYTLRPILTLRMPIFHLSEHEASVLADGIVARWRDASIDSAGDFVAGPREIEAGRQLFDRSGCLSCHQLNGKGGYVGPDFTAGTPVGNKLRPGWIVKWLENPQAIKPDVLEPRYAFSKEQARELAAYLMSLRKPTQGGSR